MISWVPAFTSTFPHSPPGALGHPGPAPMRRGCGFCKSDLGGLCTAGPAGLGEGAGPAGGVSSAQHLSLTPEPVRSTEQPRGEVWTGRWPVNTALLPAGDVGCVDGVTPSSQACALLWRERGATQALDGHCGDGSVYAAHRPLTFPRGCGRPARLHVCRDQTFRQHSLTERAHGGTFVWNGLFRFMLRVTVSGSRTHGGVPLCECRWRMQMSHGHSEPAPWGLLG